MQNCTPSPIHSQWKKLPCAALFEHAIALVRNRRSNVQQPIPGKSAFRHAALRLRRWPWASRHRSSSRSIKIWPATARKGDSDKGRPSRRSPQAPVHRTRGWASRRRIEGDVRVIRASDCAHREAVTAEPENRSGRRPGAGRLTDSVGIQ